MYFKVFVMLRTYMVALLVTQLYAASKEALKISCGGECYPAISEVNLVSMGFRHGQNDPPFVEFVPRLMNDVPCKESKSKGIVNASEEMSCFCS